MRIYTTLENKEIIKNCFKFFPDKTVFNNIRYIMDVNYNFLPKTVIAPFDDLAFKTVVELKNDGFYIRYENGADIYLNIESCTTNFWKYHVIVHELAHHYFYSKNLFSEWNSLFTSGKYFVSEYSKIDGMEFFAEHYAAFTIEEGKEWLDKNRPDVLSSIEKLWGIRNANNKNTKRMGIITR